MATDDNENPSARRLRIRRNGRPGGFAAGGSSASTRSESLRTSAEHDEVDDAIDPEVVSQRIRQNAARAPASDPASDPSRRMQEVAASGSRTYSKEYRLTLLHRLLLRNIPLDQIAQQLRVSVSTVEKDRVELKQMLREQALQLNINELVGNQTGLYDEVSGMALRIASDAGRTDPVTGQVTGGVPVAMRLAAMRTALASNADKTRFYASTGVLDALRFRRSEEGDGVTDIQLLMQQTQDLIRSFSADDAAFAQLNFADGGHPSSEEL